MFRVPAAQYISFCFPRLSSYQISYQAPFLFILLLWIHFFLELDSFNLIYSIFYPYVKEALP
ncbi:hypothetical protein R70723_02600 [Paenibacillus sp. FSL R7-0273]|nr:hypothetical protein R70723_02600 [Paenibacillus sp. FSL R7-0273]OMF93232.1 hypothetical protein BK144_10955 [Paenibacillus sp. FSL R7-0273]